MRAYYASRMSENISVTPQGYLICKNVPIARTGEQEYLGEELGLDEYRGHRLTVHREESDVFEPAALASFEAKPVTDEHPAEDVTAENVHAYLKGVTTEVRRGTGEDSDKVLADLIIYDPILISQIQAGKREISCGYGCIYEISEDGVIYQRKIRGNHVAVVPAGRAGSEVSIKDGAPDTIPPPTERSMRKMKTVPTKEKSSLFARLFPVIAKDADPEDVADAIEAIEDAVSGPEPAKDEDQPAAAKDEPSAAAPTQDEEMPPWAKALLEQMAQIQARLNASGNDEDPLKQLEDELSEEASVSKPVEQMDEGEPAATGDEDTPAATDEDPTHDEDPPAAQDIDPTTDEATEPAVSNDSLLKLVRSMKPVIAGMKDAKARKRATDALTKTIRDMQGLPKKKAVDGYSYALSAKANYARRRAEDAQRGTFDLDKQQSIYDKLNPHKKSERS